MLVGFALATVSARAEDWPVLKAFEGASRASGRAEWMSGRYGVMVHWIFADRANVDELTDAAALQAMEQRGETPAPVVTRECLKTFLRDFTSVGGGVTVNLGVDRRGRMNPKSLALFD